MDTGAPLDAAVEAAIDAALAAGRAAGFEQVRAEVLQHTNNVVVWLAPHPIVAKVGVGPAGRRLLQRESELCAELSAAGSPVATPWRDSPLHSEHGLRRGAGRYGDAHLPVSLWRQLATRPETPTPVQIATVLRRVHDDLAACDLSQLDEPLPSFLVSLTAAQDALFDDDRMAALPEADRTTLRAAFGRWFDAAVDELAARNPPLVPLHGEPHAENVLSTSHGLVVIDFEGACVGPIEWDLASVAPDVAEAYAAGAPVNTRRLVALRDLNAARTATWCFAAEHPTLHRLGPTYLARVRDAVDAGR